MKYLITGSTGWLGKNLLKRLTSREKKIEIRVLAESSKYNQLEENINDRVVKFDGDIRNKNSLNSFFEKSDGSVLIHLAGCIR